MTEKKVDCVHAARCGGCPLIELDYQEQLERKNQIARGAFEGYPELESVVFEPIGAADPITEYRVRAKLVVGKGGAIGLFARGEHDVVDIPGCRVLRPAIARVVDTLRRHLGPGSQGIVSVDLREGADERVIVTLVVQKESDVHRRIARALMNDAPEVAGVSIGLRGHPARVLARGIELVAGEREIDDAVGDVRHRASPGAFVQAHRGQAAWLHRTLRDYFERELGSLRDKRILDVYGGSGAIGLSLAEAGARVTVIETHPQAAEAARRSGLEAITGPASLLIEQKLAADAVVVNPPRRGLDPGVRIALASLEPELIAYVSCWPVTLARDLDHFVRLGYRARRVRPFDMIPLSDQVEALAILARAEIPPVRVIDRWGDLVAVEKPAHVVPQEFVMSVRALPGLEAAEAVHHFERDGSGVGVFATNADVARGAPTLTYRVLARGITRDSGVVNRDGLRTRYRRRAVLGGHSLLDVETSGVKKHAILRHLSGIGHPVVGDERHGHAPTNRHFVEKHGLDRSFLHVARATLDDRVAESALPGDLAAVVGVLG